MLPQFPPPDEVRVTNPGDFKENLKPKLKYASSALEAGAAVADARRVYSVTVSNTGAALFLQLFDAAALPADGAVPLVSVPVSAASVQFYDVAKGLPLTTGLAFCLSSTQATKTVAGSVGLFVAAYDTEV